MTTEATCHRYFEGMFPGDTPYWFSKIGIMKVVMESGFCPVCGAELRPNGTAGPSAAELAARLETAEKDTRRMDALEKAAAEWDYFEVIRPYPVSAIYVGDQAGDAAKADTIRALADALEVDA